MKLKIIISCLVLCILMSLGTVCANDINQVITTDSSNTLEIDDVSDDLLGSGEISDKMGICNGNVSGFVENDKLSSDDGVIYIDANALGDGDGTLEHPFKELNMFEHSIPDGSIINLANGEYDCSLIMFDNLVILGESSQNTIVKNAFFLSNGTNTSMFISNVTFVNSSFMYYDDFTAVDCVFNGYSDYGLIVSQTDEEAYASSGKYASITIDNCDFVDCAGGQGMVIGILSGLLQIKNSCIESIKISFVYAEYSIVVFDNVSVKKSRTEGLNNLIQLECCLLYVLSSDFDENNATGGSLICVDNDTELIIYNSSFTNNNIDTGVINANYAFLNITNSSFKNNHAKRFAGAVFTAQSIFHLENVTFEKNSALWSGGAVIALNTTLKILNCDFNNNSASYSGGALYSMYGNIIVGESFFISNNALNGGAIFLDNVSSLNTGNSLFYDNNFKDNEKYSIYAITDDDYDFGNAVSLDDIFQTKYPNLVIGDGDYSLVNFTPSFNGTIPLYYDLRKEGYVSPVKNQGPDGNCWAFASIATLESCILKALGTTYDFSEVNMKNIMAWFSDYGWNILPNNGGNFLMAIAYLTSWLGPVYENNDSYSPSNSLSEVLHSNFHIQNVLFLDYSDFDSIKTAIMKYGAVGIGMSWNDTFINDAAYYCWNESSIPNHAVTIVGWNDSYSRYNFNNSHLPDMDGAWIIKNSWGNDTGDEGYFYVSYDDKIFGADGDIIYTFIFNDTIRFDKNYQYDIQGINEYHMQQTSWYKNIFNATGNECLAAVSTYFIEDNTNYVISIFVNGQLILNQSGVSKRGYYTINLNKYISLNNGDIFEVQFKISDDDGYTYVPVGNNSMFNKELSRPDVSFISSDGVNWEDLYKQENPEVASIKAFTFNLIETKMALTVNDSQIIAIITDKYGNVLDGAVEFNIDNKTQNVDIIDGKAILGYDFKYYDIYNITATWNKTGYLQSSNNTLYETPWNVTLNVDDVAYLDDVIIGIQLGGKLLKNNITLTIRDNHYSLNQSNLMFTVPDTLNANFWNVSISYATGKGYKKVINESFNVNKKHIEIYPGNSMGFEIESVRYNSSNNRIFVCTHDQIKKSQFLSFYSFLSFSDCIITFNGTDKTIERIDGNSFYLRNLNPGIYKLNITLNHPNFEGSFYADITIDKGETSLIIPDLEIDYGEGGQVTFDSLGFSAILWENIWNPFSDNSQFAEYIIIDGKNIKVNPNLMVGNYTFSFIIDDDIWESPHEYGGTYKLSFFNVIVNQASTNVAVNVKDASYNETVIVNYAVGNIDTVIPYGGVTVTVYDENSESIYINNTARVENGCGSFRIENYKFAVGTYTVNVNYVGSNNFIGSNANCTFTVRKAESSFDSIDDIIVTYGNYTITVSGNVNGGNNYNGTVSIAIDGTPYAVDVEVDVDGSFTKDLTLNSDVYAGAHKVVVSGTDCLNYNAPDNISFNLIVEPAVAKFNAIGDVDATYGDGTV